MITIYALISLLISYMWIDSLRLNAPFQKKQMIPMFIGFLLGCGSYFLSIYYPPVLLSVIEATNEDAVIIAANFDFSLFHGLSIFICFYIIKLLFKKAFTNPIDHVIYLLCIAMGFSTFENTISLYNDHLHIIDTNTWSLLAYHFLPMFLMAYGLLLDEFYHKSKTTHYKFLYVFYTILSMAFIRAGVTILNSYDAMYAAGLLCIIFIFLYIFIFINTVNNACNMAINFSYKNVINAVVIRKRLIVIYLIVLGVQVWQKYAEAGLPSSILFLIGSILTSTMLLLYIIHRLGDINPIKHHWILLRISIPDSINVFDEDSDNTVIYSSHSYDESQFNPFFEEYFMLHQYPYTEEKQLAYIENKFFFKDEDSFFLCKLFYGDKDSSFRYVLLKPKLSGDMMVLNRYPIVAVLQIDNPEHLKNFRFYEDDFAMENWAFPVALDDDSMEH